jgi:undecaprenyl diphosphate synthase
MSQSQPQHIAIVMDGNGRWAARRHLPRVAGHRAGVKAAAKIIEAASEQGIAVLSLFAFSSENWSRPTTEITALMELFIRTLEKETKGLCQRNIQLRFIGDRMRFEPALQAGMQQAEAATANCSGMKLCIAMNYGGRWDITQAAKQLAAKVQSGDLQTDDINESLLAQQLEMADCPDPDLFIRTSGEQRISNFFLWQMAYTECYFSDVFWPEFSREHFQEALTYYASRERRFGNIAKQGV